MVDHGAYVGELVENSPKLRVAMGQLLGLLDQLDGRRAEWSKTRAAPNIKKILAARTNLQREYRAVSTEGFLTVLNIILQVIKIGLQVLRLVKSGGQAAPSVLGSVTTILSLAKHASAFLR